MSKPYTKLSKLGVGTKHRRALLRNLTTSLIKHERIETTLTKAKALRKVAERMITLGKKGDEFSCKKASSYLFERAPVVKLFTIMAERYKYRPGGYTRVMRTRRRYGDNAPMAIIEFVDREGELRKPTPCDKEYHDKLVAEQEIYKKTYQLRL